MCLTVFSYKSHPVYKLIIAANRDEFYVRKTEAARFWNQHPDLLAGQDLEQGGTWFGITKQGKFSFITNYRDPKSFRKEAPSRGILVSDYLLGSESPMDYMKSKQSKKDYNGYNLVVGNLTEALYFSNMQDEIQKLRPGFYGLSNAFLDTPWPKIKKAKDSIAAIISKNIIDPEELFAALLNEEKAGDNELPSTGIPYEIEKLVSSIFIKSKKYGTVSTTLVLVDNDNRAQFFERTYNPMKENKTEKFEFLVG